MNIEISIKDVVNGAKEHHFWMTFGMNDIKAKYRRSRIGQWWITLSVALFIFVIGGLFRGIFDDNSGTYMAYLSVGYITWLLINDSVCLGCSILSQAKPFLLQKSWPTSTFVYRLIYRETLIFAHHAVLLPPIFLWLGLWPGISGLVYGFLGLALTIFAAFWVIIFLAIISLRYRDFPPIVQSLMRMAFFATPIIWIDRDLGDFDKWIVWLNPFGYFIKIVRDPLLGLGFPFHAWGISIGLTSAAVIASLTILSVTKSRLNYWL